MSFRPLSARGHEDPRFDTLHEGFPEWLHEAVLDWQGRFLYWSDPSRFEHRNEVFLRSVQLQLQVSPVLDWSSVPAATHSLLRRMQSDEIFALDVVDFTLHHMKLGTGLTDQDCKTRTQLLNAYLHMGGSAWEVSQDSEPTKFMLTRRAVGPVVEAIDQLRSDSERAGAHLSAAWVKIAGRSPDPTGAYREAVRAVEAAAKPIVSPNDREATLGKMLRAIRDKPEKWTFALGEPQTVADMCAALWKGQSDRHGTDDEAVPLSVDQRDADAAVYLALTLVRWFAGGAMKLAN